MAHAYIARGDAQLVGDNLGEGGLSTLAVGRYARVGLHVAVGADDHPGVLLQGCDLGAGAFDHCRDAYADERTAFPGLLPRALPPFVVAGHFQGPVEGLLVFSRIVGDARRGVVGECVWRDEVAAPHFGRIEAQILGDEVDGAFHAEGGFGTARATVGAGHRLVGSDANHFDRHGRGAVGPGEAVAGQDGDGGRGHKEVGAEVGDDPDTNPQQCAILAGGGLKVDAVASPMETEHVFLAALDPLNGTAQLYCKVGYGQFLGEKASLLAISSAYIGTDHPDGVEGAFQEMSQVLAYLVGVLRRVPDSQQVGPSVVFRQQATRLHGRRGQALHVELLADDAVRRGEGRVKVTAGVDGTQDLVGSEVLMNNRCAIAGRRQRVNNGGKYFVVDVHQVDSILGGVDVVSQHDGDRLTGVAGLVHRQRRVPGRVHFIGVRRFAVGSCAMSAMS